MIQERTVGAALRGRPRVELNGFKIDSLGFREHDFNAGAATEGRPYNTFRGA
jgi:hypothetical protein